MLLVLLFTLPVINCDREFTAHFNMAGIVGDVQFEQKSADHPVSVRVNLFTLVSTGEFNASWAIHSFPVDFTKQPAACANSMIGPKLFDLDSIFGALDLSSDQIELQSNSTDINLWSSNPIWDKSIIIQIGGITSCATLLPNIPVRTMESKFVGPVAGHVLFRQIISNPPEETLISVNLFHVDSAAPANHKWQILATEVLDSRGSVEKCDHLHVLYDIGIKNTTGCSSNAHVHCPLGDLTSKHGPVFVGGRQFLFIDSNLWLPELSVTLRRLYLVLYDTNFPDTVYACAPMKELKAREIVADFDFRHVQGSVRFYQESPLDVTEVNLNLRVLGRNLLSAIAIHEYPIGMRLTKSDDVCAVTGKPFNPFQVEDSPDVVNGTYDLFLLGDLSGKYGASEGTFMDPYVHLFSEYSVLGRSVVVYLNDGTEKSCATLQSIRPVTWAKAIFYYPVAGQVFFQQLADEPASETFVFIQHLLLIFGNRVGRDFLNWTKRCESAGNIYNPTSVNLVSKSQTNCGGNTFRCALGDLSRKAGRLKIGARRSSLPLTRLFHVDVHLPLSGPNSIIGRTLAILDDFAPAFRGNRMSCAVIISTLSIHASANIWRSSEEELPLTGGIHFVQPNIFSSSRVLLELNGMQGLVDQYSINEAPVPFELDFPCVKDVLQHRFNPFNTTNPRSDISEDSRDEYAVGDLSGKYGDLNDKDEESAELLDPNLQLQGPNNVIGRSVVIFKKEKRISWACANIELDAPDGVEEIHALASFHDPKGFAYGYMRMTQLVGKNGAVSDTWIEAKLRYPGLNNKNMSQGHHWSVYVNPVGYDATVTPFTDRCVAAGFKWNPYLVVDNIDDYSSECSIWTPFRCVMGDVSRRQSTIDIGGDTKIFSDPNLPLTGDYAIIGRSVVIFDKKGSVNRFACGNIVREKRAVSVFTIKNPRYFSSALFMTQARETLGIPPWMMFADAKKTKTVVEGACVQLTVHFRGHDIQWIQEIFTDLLSNGYVSRYTPAPLDKNKPRFGYRICRTDFNRSITHKSSYHNLIIISKKIILYPEHLGFFSLKALYKILMLQPILTIILKKIILYPEHL
uniref:Uncharacterized protein n=1 Tax=Strigamia maritima TaxID=126957 RepID=T1J9S4_STRMM